MLRKAKQMRAYLNGLDRGQMMRGRIVQVTGEDVHVVLGPVSFWARARGGRPQVGWHRLEVVRPGDRPVLKLLDEEDGGSTSIVIDPSHDKASPGRGIRVDRHV